MPIEFKLQDEENSSDSTRLAMMYDGSGRRISKTLLTKSATAASWDTVKVTHYTGIGTEIREEFHNGTREKVNVVVNMPVFFRVTLTRLKPRSYIEKDILRLSNGGAILPKQSFGASRQGLGRYKVADASQPADDNASRTFEWYLKNHLGSTMLVYGTVSSTDPNTADIGETKAAYDYRAFGEQIELMPHDLDKVTENFTGKEHDEEIKLNYFGARYLDPMLGLWVSVDPKRQFASPYLYAGNGVNPVNVIDPDGKATYQIAIFLHNPNMLKANPDERLGDDFQDFHAVERWGHSEFGDDFAIRIVRNQNEMINFVKEGEYTAIVGHTWQGEEGMLFNRTHSPSDELNLNELDKALMGSDSFAKVFGCKTGKWNVEFSQIEYGGNEGKLPMGEAYKEAGRYLTEGWNTDRRLETIKPTTSDE